MLARTKFDSSVDRCPPLWSEAGEGEISLTCVQCGCDLTFEVEDLREIVREMRIRCTECGAKMHIESESLWNL